MNSYTKRGGAARRRFCVICKKPEGGGAEINPPPGCARVKSYLPPDLERTSVIGISAGVSTVY